MKNQLSILGYYLKYKRTAKMKSPKKLQAYQEKQIAKHLNFVCANSPFYRKYQGKPLSQFPIMDKQTMMEHFDQLNTLGIEKEQAISFAMKGEKDREFSSKLNNISVGLSSGTSGNRGVFLVSDKEKNMWAGYVLAKLLPHGILGKYRIAFFMRANSNLYEAVGSRRICFQFFDLYQDINQNTKELNQLAPNILVGQPSLLLALAKAKKDNQLCITPERVISIAEVLETADADIIKDAFSVPVIHQVYQCTEGCLAATCDHGSLHLNEDIVSIEKEYLDATRFVPIVTDFTRTSQPIIRYRLNDVLVEMPELCRCGSPFTALTKIEGREDDVFLFKQANGGENKVFPDFIRRCILFAGEISDYRIVQQPDQSIIIYCNLTDALKHSVMAEFAQLAQDQSFILPPIEFKPYEFDATRKLKRVERIR